MNSGQDMKEMSKASAVIADVPVATREQISRWMDGDIAPHEVELAMKTLASEDVRYCWAEMHFIGDCLRGLEPTKAGAAERIRAAVAIEPTIVAPTLKVARERTLLSSMRKVGRGGRAWATAAAIAAVGFVGSVTYQQFSKNDVSSSLAQSNGALGTGAVNAPTNANTPVMTVSADFNALLQAHQESADATSMSAVRQYLRPAVAMQPANP